MIAPELLEQKNKERKNSLEGQLSLFDFVGEEEKKQYQIQMPKVEEFPKEELLAFEKDILGVYVSGHPLDEYMQLWKDNITARTTDFAIDEELGVAVLTDGAHVTIGGMIVYNFRTRSNFTRHGFSGQCGGIQSRNTIYNDTVQRDSLAGFYNNGISNRNFFRINLYQFPVPFHVCVIRANVH